jgi:hypothetical protein
MEGQHRVGEMRQGRGDRVEGVEEEGKREGGVEGDEEEGQTGARVEDGEKIGGRMRSEVGDWEDRKEGDLSSSRCVRLMSDEKVSSSTSGLGGLPVVGGSCPPPPPPRPTGGSAAACDETPKPSIPVDG